MTTLDKDILRLALPSIVSNITVPLLGLCDVTIMGHVGGAASIGAIAVGSMVFNVMYWLFVFLRMSTGGLTAQAYGAGRRDVAQSILRRSLTKALLFGLAIVVLQVPLQWLTFWLMQTTVDVAALCRPYYYICIWGAPAVLGLYVLSGWLVGMQNTRLPMFIAVGQNVVNIMASLFFVYVCGMKVDGVAWGTLVAQWSGLALAVLLWLRFYGRRRMFKKRSSQLSYGRFLSVNRDIFLRTVCLVSVNLFFTAAGSRQGELLLSVNTLLMTLFMLFSYVMDGFAFAGEALCGRYYGARNAVSFWLVVRRLFVWGGAMVVLFTLVYAFGGEKFLHLLTSEASVVLAARPYFWWAVAVPVVSVAAFIFDGVFIGITASRGMLVSCAIATAAFFSLFLMLFPHVGNHSLWIALLVYMLLRGAVQALWLRRLRGQWH